MDVFEKEIMPHDGDDTGDCDSIYGKTFDGEGSRTGYGQL